MGIIYETTPGAKKKTIKRAITGIAEFSTIQSYIKFDLLSTSDCVLTCRLRRGIFRRMETSRLFLENVSPALRLLLDRTREFLTTPVVSEPTQEELAAAHRLMNQEVGDGHRD